MSNPNPADELLSAYVDGELTDDQRAAVEQRLAADPAARQTVDELRALSLTLQEFSAGSRGGPQALGADFTAEVVQNVQQQIASRSPSDRSPESGGSIDSSVSTSPSALSVGRSPRSWLWASMAVAAALLMAVILPSTQPESDLAALNEDAPAGREPGAMQAAEPVPVEPDAMALDTEAPSGAATDDPIGDTPATGRPDTETLAIAEESTLGAPAVMPSEMPAAMPAEVFSARSAASGLETDAAVEFHSERYATPPQLVVRVQLKPQAYLQNHVEQVLSFNGIPVEPGVNRGAGQGATDGGGEPDERANSAAGLRTRSADSSRPERANARIDLPLPPSGGGEGGGFGGDVDGGVAAGEAQLADDAPPNDGLRGDGPRDDGLAGDQATGDQATGDRSVASEQDDQANSTFNVLVVDAPASQIADALSDLQNDRDNCISIYCCPVGQELVDQQPSSQADDARENVSGEAESEAVASVDASRDTRGSSNPDAKPDTNADADVDPTADPNVNARKRESTLPAQGNQFAGQQPSPSQWRLYNRFDPDLREETPQLQEAQQRATKRRGFDNSAPRSASNGRAYRVPRSKLSPGQWAAGQIAEQHLAADQLSNERRQNQQQAGQQAMGEQALGQQAPGQQTGGHRTANQRRQQNFAEFVPPLDDRLLRQQRRLQQSQQPPPPIDSAKRVQVLVIVEREPSDEPAEPSPANPATPDPATTNPATASSATATSDDQQDEAAEAADPPQP